MATNDIESVNPETAPLIETARHLSYGSEPLVRAQNIGALLADRAAATPDKPFLAYYEETGRVCEYTYAEFYAAVRALSARLVGELGLRPGDRVATLRGNDPYTVAIYFAAWSAGLAVAPINGGEDDERVAFILRNSEARVLFASGANAERAARLAGDDLPVLTTRAENGRAEYALEAVPQATRPILPGSIRPTGQASPGAPTPAEEPSAPVEPAPRPFAPDRALPATTEALLVYTS